jgi:3-oxoacyl-[acyl-carrier-protein] synthase-3
MGPGASLQLGPHPSGLGLSPLGIPAFDINATCVGFVAALDTFSCAIAAGHHPRVLIVASDIASLGLNW